MNPRTRAEFLIAVPDQVGESRCIGPPAHLKINAARTPQAQRVKHESASCPADSHPRGGGLAGVRSSKHREDRCTAGFAFSSHYASGSPPVAPALSNIRVDRSPL